MYGKLTWRCCAAGSRKRKIEEATEEDDEVRAPRYQIMTEESFYTAPLFARDQESLLAISDLRQQAIDYKEHVLRCNQSHFDLLTAWLRLVLAVGC